LLNTSIETTRDIERFPRTHFESFDAKYTTLERFVGLSDTPSFEPAMSPWQTPPRIRVAGSGVASVATAQRTAFTRIFLARARPRTTASARQRSLDAAYTPIPAVKPWNDRAQVHDASRRQAQLLTALALRE